MNAQLHQKCVSSFHHWGHEFFYSHNRERRIGLPCIVTSPPPPPPNRRNKRNNRIIWKKEQLHNYLRYNLPWEGLLGEIRSVLSGITTKTAKEYRSFFLVQMKRSLVSCTVLESTVNTKCSMTLHSKGVMADSLEADFVSR